MLGAYGISKAAEAQLARNLALELGPEIRVNGVAPGAVLWPSDGKPYADQQSMLARTTRSYKPRMPAAARVSFIVRCSGTIQNSFKSLATSTGPEKCFCTSAAASGVGD